MLTGLERHPRSAVCCGLMAKEMVRLCGCCRLRSGTQGQRTSWFWTPMRSVSLHMEICAIRYVVRYTASWRVFLLNGVACQPAIERAVAVLREIYEEMPAYEQELEWSVRPIEPWIGQGSGYVVDCLRSAFMILLRTASYEEAVRQAILLGDDTDTTACVTGGLAGILYGFDAIPKRWYAALRGKEEVIRHFTF